jgi:hypothetical protein
MSNWIFLESSISRSTSSRINHASFIMFHPEFMVWWFFKSVDIILNNISGSNKTDICLRTDLVIFNSGWLEADKITGLSSGETKHHLFCKSSIDSKISTIIYNRSKRNGYLTNLNHMAGSLKNYLNLIARCVRWTKSLNWSCCPNDIKFSTIIHGLIVGPFFIECIGCNHWFL